MEYATLEWVDWFNNRRLLEPIEIFRLLKPTSTQLWKPKPWLRNQPKPVFGKTGAVQTAYES